MPMELAAFLWGVMRACGNVAKTHSWWEGLQPGLAYCDAEDSVDWVDQVEQVGCVNQDKIRDRLGCRDLNTRASKIQRHR